MKTRIEYYCRRLTIPILLICFSLLLSCTTEDQVKPEEGEITEEPQKTPPSVGSIEVSNISGSNFLISGSILPSGSSSVTKRGVCWSESPSPTLEDFYTEASTVSASGSFTAQVSGLKENTTYYLRGFATNPAGTAYGEELIITTERSLSATERILIIDFSTVFQTIEHFGASDAWSAQFVGKWPSAKKEAIADLLFSKEMDANGNPKGIGLSLWRFNVGAGSAEQGNASGINDEWRRAESFLDADGSYNWNRQEGQVWFAQAAQERSVENLLLFPNSPPVHMTRNGKAYASNGQSNLAIDMFDEFAVYLATVTEGLQDKGLKVDYISPVNEPQWDWSDGGQEGTPFQNHEIAGIVKALNEELQNKNIATKIDLAEAAQLNFLFEQSNKAGRANQIEAFFSPSSPNYIGDLGNVGNAISGHSYFNTSPFSRLMSTRTSLSTALEEYPELKFWMSEYCILGDNNGEISGPGRELGIKPALYIARVINTDLTVAQASAWHWWLAISPYNYKDGLVYIDHQKADGNFYESKMLWALGNFSRFIRPGYQRIAVKDKGMPSMDEDFLFSGYKNPATGEFVIIIINSGDEDVNVEFEFGTEVSEDLKAYITSAEKDLEYHGVGADELVTIPANSIMTITDQNP